MSDSAPCCGAPMVGRMCWPPGLTAPADGPHASKNVCADPACQERIAGWVDEHTGHRGVFEKVPADAHR